MQFSLKICLYRTLPDIDIRVAVPLIYNFHSIGRFGSMLSLPRLLSTAGRVTLVMLLP